MKKIISLLVFIVISLPSNIYADEFTTDYGLYELGKDKEILFLEKERIEKNNIVLEATDFGLEGTTNNLNAIEVIKNANAKAYNVKTKQKYEIKVIPFSSKCTYDCEQETNNYLLSVKDTSVTITTYSNIPDTTIKKTSNTKMVNIKPLSEDVQQEELKKKVVKKEKWKKQEVKYNIVNKVEVNYLIGIIVVILAIIPLLYWYRRYKRTENIIKKIIYTYFYR